MHKRFHRSAGFSLPRVALALVALVLLYGVGNAAYQSHLTRQAARTDRSPQRSAAQLASGSQYVAMGDSYSAGGGADRTPDQPKIDVSAYDTSTKCWRSKNAAQYLVAKNLGLELVDASCGGAVTDNLLNIEQEGIPPQLSNVTSETKLVTMTIGGNDTALLYALNCIQTSDCADNALMTTLMNLRILGLPAKLEAVYAAITSKAPHAKIRHAGYPLIISPPGEPAGTCSAWLTGREAETFHTLLTATNDKIKETVARFAEAHGTDIAYVDPLANGSPFMARDEGQLLDGCSASAKRYMNGPLDGAEGGWHPNIHGQRMYADLYEASLR